MTFNAFAVVIGINKFPNGTITTKETRFWVEFADNHTRIGYLSIAIGAIVCLSGLMRYWKKSNDEALSLGLDKTKVKASQDCSYCHWRNNCACWIDND